MILFDDALQTVMSQARLLGSEQIELDRSLHRILAGDIVADIDMPPFDKSAMDGYACRRRDLGNELVVVETIPAGRIPARTIGRNQCAGIMTGAMVPEGADCVIMVESTEQPSDSTVRFTGDRTSDNICRKAEDIRKGEIVLRKGEKITCRHIGVLAAVGCVKPRVARRPKVGVIATGDEIVEPSVRPAGSQIRNSNSYQLCAHAASVGAVAKYYGIAADTEESIDEMLREAAGENDLVLISGGVSMGEFDFVPAVLRKNGFRLLFEKIAIKPGKPTVFAVSGESFCFALPGNPVSTFVVFELLVKPFFYRMMGHDFHAPVVRMRLEKKVAFGKAERASWIPVAVTEAGGVTPVEYHGSAHLNALCRADGLICAPAGVREIAEGAIVDVRQI